MPGATMPVPVLRLPSEMELQLSMHAPAPTEAGSSRTTPQELQEMVFNEHEYRRRLALSAETRDTTMPMSEAVKEARPVF